MQITHDQARSFIQFQVERALSSSSQTALDAHLATCGECRLFAQEIQEVHNLLGPVMRKHWDRKPGPLPISTLFEKRAAGLRTRAL
jgi:predicted anti-sigma-YlaC factor YlaD